MLFIGVDPGVTGGVSALDARGTVTACFKMPDTLADLLGMLRSLHPPGAPCFAFLERVNAGVFGKPGQKMGVTSAFTFGKGLGALEMGLLAAGIPYEFVAPITWQNAIGCRTHGDKNISKARAHALFPTLTITHATADSLLIAEHCRRVVGARLFPLPEETHGKETERTGRGARLPQPRPAARQGAKAPVAG